jgi:hypothetical protein
VVTLIDGWSVKGQYFEEALAEVRGVPGRWAPTEYSLISTEPGEVETPEVFISSDTFSSPHGGDGWFSEWHGDTQSWQAAFGL